MRLTGIEQHAIVKALYVAQMASEPRSKAHRDAIDAALRIMRKHSDCAWKDVREMLADNGASIPPQDVWNKTWDPT